MNDEFEKLKGKWQSAKAGIPSGTDTTSILALAKRKQKDSLYFQYGNIAVLTLVLAGVVIFLVFLFPFKDIWSRIGVTLMISGVAVRIAIELMSVVRFLRIKLTDTLSVTATNMVSYFKLRKTINGTITITLVATYIIGFFMLAPEFSKHITLPWLIVYNVSFTLIGLVLVFQVRRGIRKEMNDLNELIRLQKSIRDLE
jgi:hypothetical protein